MRVPISPQRQRDADFDAWQVEQRFEARRRQAARRRGVGDRAGNPRRVIGHSPSVKGSSPRRSSTAVRVAVPTPGIFLSALLLLGVGFFCGALVIYRVLSGGGL